DALRAAGIPVEIVPGVSAAQGAAARLQTPLTERRKAQQLFFVTAHAHHGRLPDDLDWAALAGVRTTTAGYMPWRTPSEFCQRLVAAGAPPGRPAVAVFNATRPQQAVVTATIADLAHHLGQRQRRGPCVLLIGDVVGNGDAISSATVRG